MIKDFISAVTVMALILTAAVFTPLIGPVAEFFVPLPVMYYSARLGRLRVGAVFCLALFLVSVPVVLFGLKINFALFFLLGFFGLVLSELFKKGLTIERTVFYGTFVVLTVALLLLGYYLQGTGQNPVQAVESFVRDGVEESIGAYAQLGMSAEQVGELRKSVPHVVRAILGLFPACVVISAVTFVVLNVLVGIALLRKRGLLAHEFGDLNLWKIPDRMVWFVIAAGTLVLVPQENIRLIGLNLLVVFLFAYVLQGFAIINYFFTRKRVPVFLRWMVYALIFVQNIFLLVVAVIGFADIWVDFRKINPPAADSVSQE
ncbi:MAG: DUF2232 domain-containing protein [Syntrophobacterales bacterium]|nr:DUF2232 domain-containing protein [Syntrophobacterales bacterium]